MPKDIVPLVESSINSGNLAGVLLVKLEMSTTYRYTNAYQSVYWDEDGNGEVEYVGTGNLGQISVLTETSELGAQTIQLGLSGIPSEHITEVFGNDYIGKPAYIWYATLDKETYAVEGGSVGPVLIFAGRMDFANITFGKEASVSVNVTSRLADWERARGGRFNHSYQQRYVDPNDLGFRYVIGLQNLPITWGGLAAGDFGGTPSGGPGQGGRRNREKR